MKNCLLFGVCLILVGCGRRDAGQRELVERLDTIKTELASKLNPPMRWAVASKSDISTAIFQWSRDKLAQAKKVDALSPEIEAQVARHDALRSELNRSQIGVLPLRSPRRMPGAEPSPAEKEYEALAQRVAAAKEPVAAIIDRRDQQSAQFYQQYSVNDLVAEYAKGRYDLVMDANEKVLYQATGEVTDITEGVIALFKAKIKP